MWTFIQTHKFKTENSGNVVMRNQIADLGLAKYFKKIKNAQIDN